MERTHDKSDVMNEYEVCVRYMASWTDEQILLRLPVFRKTFEMVNSRTVFTFYDLTSNVTMEAIPVMISFLGCGGGIWELINLRFLTSLSFNSLRYYQTIFNCVIQLVVQLICKVQPKINLATQWNLKQVSKETHTEYLTSRYFVH